MKKKIFTYSLFLIASAAFAQEEEVKEKEKALNASTNLTWNANKAISENDFVGAEVGYRKAISKSGENVAAPFNLGNAYYNEETYSEAFGRFKQAGETAIDKSDKHRAYHNMGNVFMKRKEYEKAVEAYKEALRNNPTDEETRYNLALAKELLKKEQDQQKNDKDDKGKDDKDKDDKKDQNKDKKEEGEDDKEKKDEGDKGDEKKEDNKEGDGEKKEEQKKQPDKGDKKEQKPRPDQLSKQQVQNLLEAMQNEEKKVQQKIDAQKVKGVKVKNEKDW
ncbi:Aerotolerance protein BatC [hydrothermal vent metagenome]|uniref:Aerotolerance protein BatC n=1 Tax=hydrothermal vent metagenome TaxID=652676 RepID=A0A3B0T9V3_9ZZZZ